MGDQVFVSTHPLVQHKLALLRSNLTEPKKFRELVREIAQLLFYEATEDLSLAPLTVQTPLAPCEGFEVADRIGVIPILRAGLGMSEAIIDILPTVHVWHLGLYRDHETLQPVTYYNKLPSEPNIDLSLIVDPMLATGGSAVAAVDILKQWGSRRIKFLGLIAAPEGVQALTAAHPDVDIHLAAIDSFLNELGYIVPGLGDAGDRQFGTG
ncbi:uracil phosphoribosyltransferase [Candidatus Chloroploca sp. M-50]|uniref:Uracil phosphoribosyltransferase n=2 Tax=Candidatus Chloroploca TaxID=1579476 RepID=A0A2H3KKX6_9CHLR|nr:MULTISPECIES: uracil phosphoribosyltransferase [Candidatus Chloroploca]MBP1465788.1 uracil phosphoribosyltransferase [Candidatus Chloroploca mongolica]PDV98691.1 uracil phosphoribosyltransferase [Candidatus Chloroploca asiatica]